MSPSVSIIQASSQTDTVVDAQGRRLSIRRLTALDKLRLFKAAGPVLSQNQPWLGMAMLACAVVSIDDVPIPCAVNEQQIEALVARLGDYGIEAIANSSAFAEADDLAEAGN